MSTVYDAAVAREAELQEELKKVRDFLGLYRAFMSQIQSESKNEDGTNTDQSTRTVAVVDMLRTDAAREAATPDEAAPKRVRVRDNPKPTDVVAAAVEVIRNAGRPLSRREIHTTLKERGTEVRGADPIKALGTMLWRSGGDRLEQIEGKGYWVKGEPLPAEHDPLRSSGEPTGLF